MSGGGKLPDEVSFTHLDEELFDGAGATKRDLIDYLDAVHARMLPCLTDRPLSVIRDPTWPGRRSCRRTFPNTHRTGCPERRSGPRRLGGKCPTPCATIAVRCSGSPTNGPWSTTSRSSGLPIRSTPTIWCSILDPPEGAPFAVVVQAAHLVRQALTDAGMAGAVKTSGAKGLHVFVPLAGGSSPEDVAAATRAVAVRAERIDPDLGTTAFVKEEREGKVFLDSTRAGGATVVAAYSPRIRPGVPVSFPVAWEDIDQVVPADFTVHNAAGLLDGADPWTDQMPPAQQLDADLVAEGHTIPVARVQAMHEGKRRAVRLS